MKTSFFQPLLVMAGILLSAGTANALDLPFSGNFTSDTDYKLLSFNVGPGGSTVTLETVSYAGGGFDPNITLWNNNGYILGQNDDKDNANGVFDSFLNLFLGEGKYWVAITESGNFVNGTANGYYDPNASNNGFTGCQTCFGPGSGGIYDPYEWVLNIGNVISAQTETTFTPGSPPPPLPPLPGQVPAPGTLYLFGIGLLGWLGTKRRSPC